MSESKFDPERFFDAFPRFVETSETGHWLERLNARYVALIHSNRELLQGARVLDLASHDGRFAFAALNNGAEHVVGIEIQKHLVDITREHMEVYGIEPDRYTMLVGDMFDCLDLHKPFDVIFCFGILYHINDHMGLLNRIAEVTPKAIILDSKVSTMAGTVVEIRNALGRYPPPPGSNLQGYPTRAALNAMVSSFGWTIDYFDWAASGMCTRQKMQDYASGRRISAVVRCPERDVDPRVRDQAVTEVLATTATRRTEFIVVTSVAERYGLSPQALRLWIRQAKRQRSKESGFVE